MKQTHSEKQTSILAKNSFLNMFVFDNPNKKNIKTNHSEEFCDCFIHMENLSVVIQIKGNEDPNSKDWFQRKVLKEARKQLTVSVGSLCSGLYEIWDKPNKKCILKGAQDPSWVFPVIVFEKKDSHNYQQVALGEKPSEKSIGNIQCCIFSMTDFEYATSMIPTARDFIEYLLFRFNKLKDIKPGIQLLPLAKKDNKIVFFKNAKSNEEIMVNEFLLNYSKNPEKDWENARKWHLNLMDLETAKADETFLRILAHFTIIDVDKWDSGLKSLIQKSESKFYVWSDEPILIATIKNENYGIMLSYNPLQLPVPLFNNIYPQMAAGAKQAIMTYKLNGIYLLEYSRSKAIRISKKMKDEF